MSKQKELLETLLGGGTVAYHVALAKSFGSVQVGLWLSQAIFWQCKSKFANRIEYEGDTYFECTMSEFYDQTGLSPEQQAGAKEKLKQFDVLKEKRFGLPAKVYYNIDLDALATVLYRYNETGKAVTVKHRDKQRYSTRAGDGKFRPSVTVKHRDIIIESLETLESIGERALPPADGETSTLEADPLLANNNTPAAPAQKPAPADTPLTYDQRPYPKDAADLREKLRNYFTANPTQWADGVLEMGKASKWPAQKIIDTVVNFCLHKQKTSDFQKTYHEYTADLTQWFLRQEGFDARDSAKPNASKQSDQNTTFIPTNIPVFR